MVSDRLEQQIMRDAVEERPNVKIDHPRLSPAALASHGQRVQGTAVWAIRSATFGTPSTRILRIGWDTVGRACQRVVADGLDPSRLDGLVNIGVDEVSWRGHHRYLTLVTDHVTGTIVWGAGGKDTATLRKLRNRGGDLDPDDTAELADRWCSKASRSGLAPFTKVAKTNRRHRDGILAAIRQKINNAPAEGRRNHVRPITQRAYGFHSPTAALAPVMLSCAPIQLRLPHERAPG